MKFVNRYAVYLRTVPVLSCLGPLWHLAAMDVKLLLGILNRPWLMEPVHAEGYRQLAKNFLQSGQIPGGATAYRTPSAGISADFPRAFRTDGNGGSSKEGEVQVIRINYPIAKYDFCYDPGSESLQQMIHAANAAHGVKSIVLWIDSPGGQVDGTEALANVIRTSAKPIVSYTDHLMCSAAYWLGSSAREVVAHGANNGWNATIGSIGTMAQWVDYTGQLEREGAKVHTVFATASTDKWGWFRAANNGDYAQLKQELDGLNDSFLAAVKTNRAGKINLETEDVLTGKTYNAKDALKFGLIDKIGDLSYAIKRSLQLARAASNNNSTTTKMEFPKTHAAAGAESFEMMNGARWLTDEHLDRIEAVLTQNETSAATAASAAQESQQTIADLTATVDQQKGEISALEEQVKTLKSADAGTVTNPSSTKTDDFDEQPAKGKYETSFDRELRLARGR